MLDEKDQKLLLALERNARASVVDLARQIGLSRSATQERLGRLERRGVIARYTVVRGSAEPGPCAEALLLVRHAPGGNCSKAAPELRRIAEVRSIHALAGEEDLAIWVRAPDVAGLDQVATKIRSHPAVGSVTTHVVLAEHSRA